MKKILQLKVRSNIMAILANFDCVHRLKVSNENILIESSYELGEYNISRSL